MLLMIKEITSVQFIFNFLDRNFMVSFNVRKDY